jgi:hypothetical protein
MLLILGLPLAALATIYLSIIKSSGTNVNPTTRIRYGFLFEGYKRSYWYWESVVLIKKVILIASGVFVNSGDGSDVMKGVIAALIITTAGILHYIADPFDDPMINRMESLSLYIGGATVVFHYMQPCLFVLLFLI